MFPSRTRAAASVLAGEVLGSGAQARRQARPGGSGRRRVEVDDVPRFVSRGGIKLANALDALAVEVAGRSASTWARRPVASPIACCTRRDHVVALDVAYGELDWRLRDDPRVTVIERCNARSLAPMRCRTARADRDRRVLHLARQGARRRVLACAAERFDALALVKPQFEVGRGRVGKGGVVRDPAARRGACWRWRARLGRGRVVGFFGSVCRGRRGTSRRSFGSRRRARGAAGRAAVRTSSGRRGGGTVNPVRTATVMTHGRPTRPGRRSTCSPRIAATPAPC